MICCRRCGLQVPRAAISVVLDSSVVGIFVIGVGGSVFRGLGFLFSAGGGFRRASHLQQYAFSQGGSLCMSVVGIFVFFGFCLFRGVLSSVGGNLSLWWVEISVFSG